MDTHTMLRKRSSQRFGKAPGRAALAADQDDGIGLACGNGTALLPATRLGPGGETGPAEDRNGKCGNTEKQAEPRHPLAGVQHGDDVCQAIDLVRILPGEQFAGALVDIAFASSRLQGKHVARIAGSRKAEGAKRVDRGFLQKGYGGDLSAHSSADLRWEGRSAGTRGQITEC